MRAAPVATAPQPALTGRTVLLLALLALGPRLLVAWELPLAASPAHPECAPDEGLQYWTVMRYADGDFATWPASGSIYSAYPPVPYAAHTATLALARLVPGDGPARFPSSWWRLRRYPAARLGGVLLGCLTVICAALAAAAWGVPRRLAIASGVAVAFLPQLVFVNGYVNADAFTIAAVALLTVALARWAAAGESRGAPLVGIAAGLVVLGKPNGYVALVPTAVWLLGAWRRGRLDTRSLVAAATATIMTAAPPLLVNAVRNSGDPLGLAKYRELLTAGYVAHPGTGAPLRFLRELAESSFGVFRNADLRLPTVYYVGAALFVTVALGLGARRLGASARERRQAGAPTPPEGGHGRAVWWLVSVLASSVGLVIWNAAMIDRQAQGRYLLPALVPLWIAVTCGLAGKQGRGTALVIAWLVFLGAATVAGLALIHAHPCV